MSAVTDAELTILGLLAEQPRHGYELEQVIDERGIRQWTALGFSSIYYLLDKLTAKGFVAAGTDGPRGRKVFSVTAAGIQACGQAARAALAEVRPTHPSVLAGLANSPLLDPGELAAALRERAEALDRQHNAVTQARERQQPLPAFVDAIFDYGLSVLEAERQWLARTSGRLGAT